MSQTLHVMQKKKKKGDSKPNTKIYLSLKKTINKSKNLKSEGCTGILPIIVRILPIIAKY
jgi:hypothetical protein